MSETETITPDTIHHRCCLQGMAEMRTESVDLIITDPPFAIDFKAKRTNYNRTAARVLEGYNEITEANYAEFSRQWMLGAFRVLKKNGNAFVFSGWNNLKDILAAADEAGFETVNHIIWKYQFGVSCRRRFVTSHYHCLYLCRNDSRRRFYPESRHKKNERDRAGSLQYRDMEDVWIIKREYWNGDVKTPTKLPRELIEKILAYASCPDDLVFDPFLGSGQVAVVAKMNKRRYIGFEITKAYYDFAQKRLTSGEYRIKAEDTPRENTLLAGM